MALVRRPISPLLFPPPDFASSYCAVLQRDPQDCYDSISIRVLYSFFDWSLNQKVGKDGRKKHRTTKKSSLGTYWNVFQLVFERARG